MDFGINQLIFDNLLLSDAVYSEKYTGEKNDPTPRSASRSTEAIQRIPFFTLIQRNDKERDERAKQLNKLLKTAETRCCALLNLVKFSLTQILSGSKKETF